MRVLFCCFAVYVVKGKNFQISPIPVMFCLEKELWRDSFMHCLESFLERSGPWTIDISNLFRSITRCLHHLCSSCASSWTKLAWNRSVWVDVSIQYILFYKGLGDNYTCFAQHSGLESFVCVWKQMPPAFVSTINFSFVSSS